MDKYNEVAEKIYIGLDLNGQDDLDRVIAILRECFPQVEASGELDVQAEEFIETAIEARCREMACDFPSLEQEAIGGRALFYFKHLAARPAPTAEEVRAG